MSTDEYVPSDARMREQYIWAHAREAEGVAEQSYGIQVCSEVWDAWLAAHYARVRRDAKAEAWDEATRIALNFAYLSQEDRITLYLRPPHDRNPYRETGDSDERR